MSVLVLPTPAVVPVGAPGVGISSVSAEGNLLRIELTDGQVSLLRLPILDGSGGLDLSAVMSYVDPLLADKADQAAVDERLAAKAEVTHAHATADVVGLDATLAGMQSVLDALGGEDLVTSQQVADAIAALQVSQYLRISDAAATYAPKAHTHTSAQISDFAAAVDARVGAVTDLGSYAKTVYVDQRITDLAIEDYLPRAEAGLAYATKADVAAKWTAPATGTAGDVLTWDGAKLTLQPLSSGQFLTKATADNAYAPKAHAHAIADVTGLQAALDGKLTQAQADARYVRTRTEVFGMGGVVAVKAGGGRAYTSGTITRVHASVGTAGAVTVDVLVNGTVVRTLSIAAGQNTAETSGLSIAVPTGQWIGVDVTAADGVAADLVVRVEVS